MGRTLFIALTVSLVVIRGVGNLSPELFLEGGISELRFRVRSLNFCCAEEYTQCWRYEDRIRCLDPLNTQVFRGLISQLYGDCRMLRDLGWEQRKIVAVHVPDRRRPDLAGHCGEVLQEVKAFLDNGIACRVGLEVAQVEIPLPVGSFCRFFAARIRYWILINRISLLFTDSTSPSLTWER
ncbi:hypothetical protein [Nesterenkonia jeotgali]|uniref:Uncharacterized protein n=1 Tax=Nesterenkonia jeotgali TaxID=317018 RepID=A0A839FP36_9MICC|nr:hypothetical protein [Nesterenkonia jeotgali]MBA8921269.1 hypothetical protein [Nesterenkonia jeotgali]